MKVLVCGGRDFIDVDFLDHALNEIHNESPITFIINGTCEGADKASSVWAKAHGVHAIEIPALWTYYGKNAGTKRNEAMLKAVDIDLIVAFAGGNGTANMIKHGYANDIDVIDLRGADIKTKSNDEIEKDDLIRKLEDIGKNSNDKYQKILDDLKDQHGISKPMPYRPFEPYDPLSPPQEDDDLNNLQNPIWRSPYTTYSDAGTLVNNKEEFIKSLYNDWTVKKMKGSE